MNEVNQVLGCRISCLHAARSLTSEPYHLSPVAILFIISRQGRLVMPSPTKRMHTGTCSFLWLYALSSTHCKTWVYLVGSPFWNWVEHRRNCRTLCEYCWIGTFSVSATDCGFCSRCPWSLLHPLTTYSSLPPTHHLFHQLTHYVLQLTLLQWPGRIARIASITRWAWEVDSYQAFAQAVLHRTTATKGMRPFMRLCIATACQILKGGVHVSH